MHTTCIIFRLFGCLEFGPMDLDLRAQIQNLCLANLKEIDLDLAQIQLVFDKSKTINLKSGGI